MQDQPGYDFKQYQINPPTRLLWSEKCGLQGKQLQVQEKPVLSLIKTGQDALNPKPVSCGPERATKVKVFPSLLPTADNYKHGSQAGKSGRNMSICMTIKAWKFTCKTCLLHDKHAAVL